MEQVWYTDSNQYQISPQIKFWELLASGVANDCGLGWRSCAPPAAQPMHPISGHLFGFSVMEKEAVCGFLPVGSVC